MSNPPALAQAVVRFWREAGREAWFAKDEAFDEAIRSRFESLHHAAARGECGAFEESAEGALALVLLLDQFPRNLYRGSAHAFATDALARNAATRAIGRGFDADFEEILRCFFYLPFEHSEDARDQARSMALFAALGNEEYTRYAQVHADIIARFGRFPHRNAALGRASTAQETAFLREGGFHG
ncbi:MAG: DUF924 family protein [Alphaproteobacteria bacterium]|nr:DUF924 family protein [Alphaproteobacteria bacterium]